MYFVIPVLGDRKEDSWGLLARYIDEISAWDSVRDHAQKSKIESEYTQHWPLSFTCSCTHKYTCTSSKCIQHTHIHTQVWLSWNFIILTWCMCFVLSEKSLPGIYQKYLSIFSNRNSYIFNLSSVIFVCDYVCVTWYRIFKQDKKKIYQPNSFNFFPFHYLFSLFIHLFTDKASLYNPGWPGTQM